MKKKTRNKKRKIKDLHLDKYTSHGGWPGGHRGSWNNKTPVNKQITDWLDSMGLLADVKHGRLSERKLRKIVRTIIIESYNYIS